jgi:hypothetical protein
MSLERARRRFSRRSAGRADRRVQRDLRRRRSKVALLQSKRLYPDGTTIREEALADYEIGFARLADSEDEAISMGFATGFRFSDESVYGQIRGGSDQDGRDRGVREAGAAEGLVPAL